MTRYIPAFMLTSLLFASCQFNPNLQGSGAADLQGTWHEVAIAYQEERIQYAKHTFRFDCDSVYISIKTFSDMNIYPDSCYNDGIWDEYAKGIYELKNDTLIMTTTFTKDNFKQKISGCYRIGQFLPVFKISKLEGDSLKLDNLLQHGQLNMVRTVKTICEPQALN